MIIIFVFHTVPVTSNFLVSRQPTNDGRRSDPTAIKIILKIDSLI